jgi:hypothetical protein
MRICIISSGYPPSDAGGIGTYSHTLATGLAQSNACVVVLAKDKADLYTVEDGVHVYRKNSYFTIPLIEKVLPGISWSIYVYFWLKRNTKKYGFDVVEFPNWEAPGLVAQIMMRSVKSVVRVHTPFFETLEIDGPGKAAVADKMACYQEKMSCLKADLLVSSTQKHAMVISSEYSLDVSRIKIVPLGVRDRYSTNSLQLKYERPRPGFRVLYVSRLEHRKGTLLLIDALPEILHNRKAITVDIIGRDRPHAPGGHYFQDYFREKYRAYEGQVTFHGFVEDSELDEFYKAADIFLVPSLYESFGLIYAEAMMYGLPSIATDGGGIPEVITDHFDGLLLKERTVDELVVSVLCLYNDPILLKRLSFNARRSFEVKFDQHKMVNETERAYKLLL